MIQITRKILPSFFVVSIASILAACGASNDSFLVRSDAQSDVEMIEADAPISDKELVLAAGSELTTDGFRDKVYEQIKANFLGFLLSEESDGTEIFFTGPLKVFSGKYFQEPKKISSPWPRDEFKDEHWQEIRDSAQSAKLLFSENAKTLRIYDFPARVGWEQGQYKYDHALLIAHINPKDGKRTYRFFKDGKLYNLKNIVFPKSIEDVSLVSNLEAGEKVKADVTGPTGRVEKGKIIPAKLYSVKSAIPDFKDEGEPLGEPLKLDSSALTSILNHHIEGQAQSEDDFKTVLGQF